jgi:signal transduction histidine kinase
MNTPAPARFAAWSLAALALVLAAAGIAAGWLAPGPRAGAALLQLHVLFVPVAAVVFALMGALVAARRPRNSIGWLLSGVGVLSGLTLLAGMYGEADANLPGTALARWLDLWIWIPANLIPLTFLLLLFPDGQLPSPRWWPVAWAAGLGIVAACLDVALRPSLALQPNPLVNLPGLRGAVSALNFLEQLAAVFLSIGVFGSLAALLVRFRRSRNSEREQLKWLVYAAVVAIVAIGALTAWYAIRPDDPLAYELNLAGVLAALILIALATGIAILRYRLYDIDLVINRTLVYGALTAAIAGLYALIVGGFGVLLQARESLGVSVIGIVVVAIVAQPVRDRLQRAVNRLMYGERDDPYAVLSHLARRLEATLAPEAVLPNVVESVAQALKLPYVAIALAPASDSPGHDDAFPIAAAYGAPAADVLHLPLVYQAETVGALLVSPRAGEVFAPADRRLLADLARQTGVAAHTVRLTAGLQRSREQLVTAREEERRRLRRDLHDGLGSQLAALHLRAGTLRRTLPPGLPDADAGVAELQAGIHAAIADIRRLVYELRPPALDELGLAGALRSLAAQCSSANGLQVRVDAPEPLPPLPAAVEVAGYRIAQEALANVVRHAQARICRVRVTLAQGPADERAHELRLEIDDDGRGLAPGQRAGVGLRSMRERAAELGGSCTVDSGTGGVHVLVRLPLGAAKG